MAGISIGSNISALQAQRRLSEASNRLAATFERMSSGLRINRASDDAAGLSIASRLDTDSRVYSQGIKNLNDGLSMLNIAQGALGELSSITMRIKELAEQAANSVYSLAQRRVLNSEANTLVNEFNRIVGSTSFNGMHILDRSTSSLSLQGGYGTDGSLMLALADKLGRTVGDGTFGAYAATGGAGAARGLATGDFNGDGNLDFAQTYTSNQVRVCLGNGHGSFNLSLIHI